MSLEDHSSLLGNGGEPSHLQAVQKPVPPGSQIESLTQDKTFESGQSTSKYSLVIAASLVIVGGLIYMGYQLSRPNKKSRPSKILQGEISASERHDVLIERKQNEDVGIFLCPGEKKRPGAFVAANRANEDLGLEIGAQLVEINEKMLDPGMSYKDVVLLLAKSCYPKGRLGFKKNPALGQIWKKAEVAKECGNTLFKNKKFDEAMVQYSIAIEQHPTNIFYYSNKASALYSKAKANPKMAIEIYVNALSLCKKVDELDILKNFKKGHHIRGVILFELGRYEEAKDEFETYMYLDNTNKKVRARLEECEKALADSLSAKIDNLTVNLAIEDDMTMRMSYADIAKSPAKPIKNESPSPVLVDKPEQGADEQGETKIDQERTAKNVVDNGAAELNH